MSELAADGIPVAVTCRVLNIAGQPYYRWLARSVTDAELAAACRADALFDAHRDDPEFGYGAWPMRPALPASRWSSAPPGKSAPARASGARSARMSVGARAARSVCRVHDVLVCRDFFTTDGPSRLWLANITEHRTGEGKLYLCAIKGVWSNRIAG
ncbi:hypothetical protein GCM10027186_53610 [Micromonospora schwarzwaldensis]